MMPLSAKDVRLSHIFAVLEPMKQTELPLTLPAM